jgi:hypothetical protein
VFDPHWLWLCIFGSLHSMFPARQCSQGPSEVMEMQLIMSLLQDEQGGSRCWGCCCCDSWIGEKPCWREWLRVAIRGMPGRSCCLCSVIVVVLCVRVPCNVSVHSLDSKTSRQAAVVEARRTRTSCRQTLLRNLRQALFTELLLWKHVRPGKFICTLQ